MKAMRNIVIVMVFVLAAIGLVACGMDDNADEDASSVTTEVVTTMEEITDEPTTEEITERETETETEKEKKKHKDDGVVGDIIDDAETKVDEIQSDLED